MHVRAVSVRLRVSETLPSGIDLETTMHVCHRDAVGNGCVLREIGQAHYRAGVLKRAYNLGHTKKASNCHRSCDGSSIVVVISFSASQCCAAATRSKRRRPGNSISFIGFERQRFEGFRAW